MLYYRKLESFTLAETLVALILMVIIVGLASTIISFTTSNIKVIRKNENGYRDLEQLELLLELDFSRNHQLRSKNNILVAKTELDSLKYFFNRNNIKDEMIIMRQKDTVLSGDYHLVMFKDGDSVSAGAIDALQLSHNKTNHRIFIYKSTDLKTQLESLYGF